MRMRDEGYTSSKNNVAAKVFIPILRKALCRNTKGFFSVRRDVGRERGIFLLTSRACVLCFWGFEIIFV